ncbi:SAV_915 family protein [Streptomyces sp. NPDC058052]|uniref:SAV_915 family protein n=1 Tax=Streptomyces sp. NPDC058052 TaxID=3346316 RepID=UPI0036EF30CC
MEDALYGDAAEPGGRLRAGRLCVPVRPGPRACVTRLFRTPFGDRTAVAFSGPARLREALGAAQPWIVLAEPALRALVEPLGIRELRIDPAGLPGPAPVSVPAPAPVSVSVPVPATAPVA